MKLTSPLATHPALIMLSLRPHHCDPSELRLTPYVRLFLLARPRERIEVHIWGRASGATPIPIASSLVASQDPSSYASIRLKPRRSSPRDGAAPAATSGASSIDSTNSHRRLRQRSRRAAFRRGGAGPAREAPPTRSEGVRAYEREQGHSINSARTPCSSTPTTRRSPSHRATWSRPNNRSA